MFPSPQSPETSNPAPRESADTPTFADDRSKPDSPSAAESPAEAGADEPQGSTAAQAAAPPRRKGILLDLALVLLLLGTLGAASYFIYDSMTRYHVPTPLEEALAENEQLRAQRDSLSTQYRQAADELKKWWAKSKLSKDRQGQEDWMQLSATDVRREQHRQLAELDTELEACKNKLKELSPQIARAHNKVLAMQLEIRQEDDDLRARALGMLNDLPAGDLLTTDGKTYRNAIFKGYDQNTKRIGIRYDEGHVTIPVRRLARNTLPDLARYALGYKDLIDTSDFENEEADNAAPADTKAKKKKKNRRKKTVARSTEDTDYEPSGTPVLDTEANRTSTTRVPDEGNTAPAGDIWDAPTGDLPM